ERIATVWRARRSGCALPPLVVPAAPAQVKGILDRVAPLVFVAPVEADLQVTLSGVAAREGRSGSALDVEASIDVVIEALAAGQREAQLVTAPVAPRLSDPEPARAQAQAILSQPFVLVAEDAPTDYYTEFPVPHDRLVSWLRPTVRNGPDGAHMALQVDISALEAWLRELAPQVGEDRLLDVPETVARVWQALVAGEHTAAARIRHPERRYTVQPGDNLFDIAYSYGFPRWQLEVANPDVEPSALEIGMELVIPSIDVLLPEPIAPGKLIEINLPEQRLRSYEEGQLRYEFTCSSGMSSTPTIAGQFQVLIKEDSAYAPRWDLDMPYFLGIYLEGPDFYNGIHELPIAGDGRRLWAGVLGWPASYGCIILGIGDAATLYDWAPIGTLVRIKGVAPGTPVYREEAPPRDGEPPPEGAEEPPAGDEAPSAGEETPPTEPPDETSAPADGGP
ncbi:MAG: L,D-transpeptidase family protein, partial [Anaerolineales bacterium]|nr:L,D-transpeptidase family protein [Anaerolineales bacterium]